MTRPGTQETRAATESTPAASRPQSGSWGPALLRALLVCGAVFVVLESFALLFGLTVVGRHGGGAIQGWDDTVQQWSIGHRARLVGLAEVVALGGDAPVLGVLSVLASAVLLFFDRRMRAVAPLVAYLGGEGLVFVTRQVVSRHRPLTAVWPAPHAVPGVRETSLSYPSGHATAAVAVLVSLAALAVCAWPGVRRWLVGGFLSFGAVFVAWTRLVLGVHWFSDVAVGLVLGVAWGLTAALAFRDVPWPLARRGRLTTGPGSNPPAVRGWVSRA